jgi:FkbM family methyltransferase
MAALGLAFSSATGKPSFFRHLAMTLSTALRDARHAIKRIIFGQLPPSVREAIDLVYYERRLIERSLVDEPELKLLPRLVPSGGVAIDIGANLGAYTLALHELVGPTGTVHACEPVPRSYRLLVHNCHKLAIHKNIVFHEVAIGEREGETDFFLPVEGKMLHPNYYVGGLLKPEASAVTFRVRAVRLDTWKAIAGQSVGFVKIDVEGAEVLVFRGALEFLREHRPAIVCEISADNVPVIQDMLSPLGYTMYDCSPGALRPFKGLRAPTVSPNCVLLHDERLAEYGLGDLLKKPS